MSDQQQSPEGISTDQDESFKEIERLKGKLTEASSASHWAHELLLEYRRRLIKAEHDLAAMKLRAEKAESAMEAWHKSRQCVCCTMRDKAERERDSWKEAYENLNAAKQEHVKQIGQIMKERDTLRDELAKTNEQLQILKSEFLSQIFERFKSDDRIRKWATEQLAALAGKGEAK